MVVKLRNYKYNWNEDIWSQTQLTLDKYTAQLLGAEGGRAMRQLTSSECFQC